VKSKDEARRIAKGQMKFFDKMMKARDSMKIKELKHRINVLEMDLTKAKIELEIARNRNTK